MQQNPKQWLQTSAPQTGLSTPWPLPREYYDDGQLTENDTLYINSLGGKFPGLIFCCTFDTTGFTAVAPVTLASFEAHAWYAFRCRRTMQFTNFSVDAQLGLNGRQVRVSSGHPFYHLLQKLYSELSRDSQLKHAVVEGKLLRIPAIEDQKEEE